MTDDRLDLGLSQAQRLLDNQLSSVDTIQTKIGVLLGFAATTLALLFSFGAAWVMAHRILAAISGTLLFGSVTAFGSSLMLEEYVTAPDLTWLIQMLNDTSNKTEAVQENVIGAMWKAYDENKSYIDQRFRLVNWAIVLLVLGLGVFFSGVLLT